MLFFLMLQCNYVGAQLYMYAPIILSILAPMLSIVSCICIVFIQVFMYDQMFISYNSLLTVFSMYTLFSIFNVYWRLVVYAIDCILLIVRRSLLLHYIHFGTWG